MIAGQAVQSADLSGSAVDLAVDYPVRHQTLLRVVVFVVRRPDHRVRVDQDPVLLQKEVDVCIKLGFPPCRRNRMSVRANAVWSRVCTVVPLLSRRRCQARHYDKTWRRVAVGSSPSPSIINTAPPSSMYDCRASNCGTSRGTISFVRSCETGKRRVRGLSEISTRYLNQPKTTTTALIFGKARRGGETHLGGCELVSRTADNDKVSSCQLVHRHLILQAGRQMWLESCW